MLRSKRLRLNYFLQYKIIKQGIYTMQKRFLTLGMLVAFFVMTASSAHASILFTDLGSFLGATSGTTNIDFEENSSGIFTSYGSSSAVFNGVSFTGSNSLFTVDPDYSPSFYEWGSGDVLIDAFGSAYFDVLLDKAGFTALGADIMSIEPYASAFEITLSTGEVFHVNSSDYPDRAFAGFTSCTPITSARFQATGASHALMDNFVFGNANGCEEGGGGQPGIPEPLTLSMVALGLSGLALKRFKK